ncbi:hypothetical protein AOLI_G00184110 [Acnodon oligacanthus]
MNCTDIHERFIPTDIDTAPFSSSLLAISLPVIKHLPPARLHGLSGFAYAPVRPVTREYLQTITRWRALAWSTERERERVRETSRNCAALKCRRVSKQLLYEGLQSVKVVPKGQQKIPADCGQGSVSTLIATTGGASLTGVGGERWPL